MNNKNTLRRPIQLFFLTLFSAAIFSSCGVFVPFGSEGEQTTTVKKEKNDILLVASSDGFINSYAFNPSTLRAEHTGHFASPSPSSIVMNRMDDVLYIANNLSDKATITSADFNKNSGKLTLLNQSYVKGKGPVSIDIFADKIVSANLIDGSITLFHLQRHDGRLNEADWRIDLGEGRVSNPSDITFTKDGEHLYVVDKGQDMIFHFRSHHTIPPLTIDTRNIALPEGSQPLELIFDNRGKDGYLLCEEDSNIYHYRYHDGDMELVGKYDTRRTFGSKGTAIAINPNGHYLYVTHTGSTNGISIFNRNTRSGELSLIETQKVGEQPSKIALSPDGKYIAIAAEGASQVHIYRLNPSNGLMTKAGTTIKIKRPVDIIWRRFLR